MSEVKPYLPSDLDGASFSWDGDYEVYDRVAATVRALAAAQKRIAELEAVLEVKRNTCTTHAGARMACGQCHDSLRSHLAEAGRRVTELEAQVATALSALDEVAASRGGVVQGQPLESISQFAGAVAKKLRGT